MTDRYLQCQFGDKDYAEFHDASVPRQLSRYLQRRVGVGKDAVFRLVHSGVASRALAGKYLGADAVRQGKHRDFYQRHFSPWFWSRVPQTH